ncbi:MAG TPA: hypothetical protein VD838_18055, partial [Anaeromyxobacteraceae bacterium]|nr:hypothetical protein [Anaeromyxobacteraceae bacterium]
FVRIFDASGMETHRFGDDGSLGVISRVVVLDEGQLVVLTRLEGKSAYVLCDFRGEPIERIELSGLPEQYGDFAPDQLVHRRGSLYFGERGRMRVVVTDLNGRFRQAYQLRDLVASAMSQDTEQKLAGSIDGFNVDDRGNLLFTMSTMFSGAVVSPGSQASLFGSRGSRPGRFNVIGGIDADENGNLFVSDRLRSVISVWSRDREFLGEFGYRGDGPTNLLTPYEIAVGNGKVYVAQAGRRGVRVFRVRLTVPERHEPAAPPPLPPPRGERSVG